MKTGDAVSTFKNRRRKRMLDQAIGRAEENKMRIARDAMSAAVRYPDEVAALGKIIEARKQLKNEC